MRNHFIILLCALVFSILIFQVSQAQNNDAVVIISGLPIKKDMSDIEGTDQTELSKNEQWNYRLEIIKKGRKYYWASRENRELLFRKSEKFYNFVEPNGAGYIRVVKTEKGVLYMEHLTVGLKNITYWGVAIESDLPR
jgi:hypothetical protein